MAEELSKDKVLYDLNLANEELREVLKERVDIDSLMNFIIWGIKNEK